MVSSTKPGWLCTWEHAALHPWWWLRVQKHWLCQPARTQWKHQSSLTAWLRSWLTTQWVFLTVIWQSAAVSASSSLQTSRSQQHHWTWSDSVGFFRWLFKVKHQDKSQMRVLGKCSSTDHNPDPSSPGVERGQHTGQWARTIQPHVGRQRRWKRSGCWWMAAWTEL